MEKLSVSPNLGESVGPNLGKSVSRGSFLVVYLFNTDIIFLLQA